MINTSIVESRAYIGKRISLTGWVNRRTRLGKLVILELRDGTGYIQCIFSRAYDQGHFAAAHGLTRESSVRVTGLVVEDQRPPSGYELTDCEVVILQQCEDSFPLNGRTSGSRYQLDQRHLAIRSGRSLSIMKLRDSMIWSVRSFFKQNDFLCVDAPLITPAACESTTGIFNMDYYGNKAFLSQSGQLYLEAACFCYEKVYSLGPVLRSEKKKSRRHLTEFWMIEPEITSISLSENMSFQEMLLQHIIHDLTSMNSKELLQLGRKTEDLAGIIFPLPRVSYSDALDLLKKSGCRIEWGKKIHFNAEKLLSSMFKSPFFIHHHPVWQKSFYMKPDPENPDCALSCDLIAPHGYGELSGGGQRIDDHQSLRRSILENELPLEAFQWYLDLRKYGSVPHGGFGMGVERVLSWICGLAHIQEAVLFPRTVNRMIP